MTHESVRQVEGCQLRQTKHGNLFARQKCNRKWPTNSKSPNSHCLWCRCRSSQMNHCWRNQGTRLSKDCASLDILLDGVNPLGIYIYSERQSRRNMSLTEVCYFTYIACLLYIQRYGMSQPGWFPAYHSLGHCMYTEWIFIWSNSSNGTFGTKKGAFLILWTSTCRTHTKPAQHLIR